MGQFAVYTFISGLVLLASYIVYKWLLADAKQPGFNRAVLLLIYALSFMALPLSENLLSAGRQANTAIDIDEITGVISGTAQGTIDFAPVATIVLWIYLAGMMATTLWAVVVIYRIRGIIASGNQRKLGGFTLVTVSRRDIAPFSWRNYVVMGDEENPASAEMILCHERAHIECLHFVDLVLAQVACIVLWYNPASWLMLSELKSVHEYQADSHVLASGVNCRQYQLLLIKKAVGVRFPSLANSLNHSKLKKRITMMYNQKSSAGKRTRALAIVPAVALTLALVNIPSVSKAFDRASDASLNFAAGEFDTKVTNSQRAGQLPVNISVVATSGDTVSDPDKLPQYPGGEMALMRYLMKNVKYPAEAEKAGAEGKVIVHFTVNADGTISDVNVPVPVNPALDAEAIRVVKAMNVRWKPAENGSKKINYSFRLPISFKLQK